MIKIILNDKKQKGVYIMSKGKNKKRNDDTSTKINLIKILKDNIVYIFSSVLSGAFVLGVSWCSFNNRLSNIENSIENINTTLVSLNEFNETTNDYLYKFGGVQHQLANINDKLGIIPPPIELSSEFKKHTGEYNNKNNSSYSSDKMIKSKTLVGTDSNGNVYLAENLIGKTVLLTYREKDDNGYDVDIYFLGQYNKNYHWNGFCVTNSYYHGGKLDGKLRSICESDFKNGERLNFKSIEYQPIEKDWLYSDRDVEGNVNIGINKHYSFEYNEKKNYANDNIKTSDILYVDNFLSGVDSMVTKYYSGDTSNSYFNDTSGKAYRATYFEDGTIETLYVGNFVDGYPNDDTGNAWEIYYSDVEESYIYVKGTFKDDAYVGNKISKLNTKEIKEITSIYDFECELKWK